MLHAGQVLNKVYAAPGPPDILSGLAALAGHPINWAHLTGFGNKGTAPVVNSPETQRYVCPYAATDAEKLQLKHRAQEAADATAATRGVVPAASVTELISREPGVSTHFE